jgi:hypothetical protein
MRIASFGMPGKSTKSAWQACPLLSPSRPRMQCLKRREPKNHATSRFNHPSSVSSRQQKLKLFSLTTNDGRLNQGIAPSDNCRIYALFIFNPQVVDDLKSSADFFCSNPCKIFVNLLRDDSDQSYLSVFDYNMDWRNGAE